jgi:hypothetical protein
VTTYAQDAGSGANDKAISSFKFSQRVSLGVKPAIHDYRVAYHMGGKLYDLELSTGSQSEIGYVMYPVFISSKNGRTFWPNNPNYGGSGIFVYDFDSRSETHVGSGVLLDCSPDGKYVGILYKDSNDALGEIVIYSLKDDQHSRERFQLGHEFVRMESSAMSNSGILATNIGVFGGDGNSIAAPLYSITDDHFREIEISEDGSCYAYRITEGAEDNQTARPYGQRYSYYDIVNDKEIFSNTFVPGTTGSSCLDVMADGRCFVFGVGRKVVRVLRSGELIESQAVPVGYPSMVTISKDGKRVICIGVYVIYEFDEQLNLVWESEPFDERIGSMAISPYGDVIAASHGETITVIKTNEPVRK